MPVLDLGSVPKPNSNFKPSPQQAEVFEWVKKGSGSLKLVAVAGSGKTTTLEEACKLMSGSIAFAAYNKKIADEISRRLASSGSSVQARTFHSFGFSAWKKAAPNFKVDDRNTKMRDIVDGLLGRNAELAGPVLKLVSLAKNHCIGVTHKLNDEAEWLRLCNHYNIRLFDDDGDESEGDYQVDLINTAIEALRISNEMCHSLIDFDDMLYAPLVHHARVWQNDWLLVDEAQDTNPARRLFARRMLKENGRAIFVGDPCHPPDTLISVVRGSKGTWSQSGVKQIQLDQVVVGDTVVSYSPSDCAFYFNRKVEGITRRPYDDELVVIKTDSSESRYTVNHHCFASFSALREGTAVYVMRKGTRFRIGRAKMDYGSNIGSGPIRRAASERADALWILQVYATDQQAAIAESVMQAAFGIPDITFVAGDSNSFLDTAALDECWKSLEQLDLPERASRLLEHYGRRLEYPIWTPTGYASFKRPAVYHACNLLDGCLVLPYQQGKDNHVKRIHWVPITVMRVPYRGEVISLAVSHDKLYVADNIVTHNCQAIYGFTGADADSMEIIKRDFNCSELPLTITYRCPKKVVALAQNWVSHIQAADSAPDGIVTNITEQGFKASYGNIAPTSVILCRNTAPLVQIALDLIKQRIRCHVEGRDIGKGLTLLTQKWKITNLSEYLESLRDWAEVQCQKFYAKKREREAESLLDKVETIYVIARTLGIQGSTVFDLQKVIRDIFEDTDPGQKQAHITLSTVHKAKGREWPTVYLYGRNKYMPSKYARQDWELEQEDNLIYVAVTRAKEKLVEVMVSE